MPTNRNTSFAQASTPRENHHIHSRRLRPLFIVLVLMLVLLAQPASLHAFPPQNPELAPEAAAITLWPPNGEIQGCENFDVEIWINDVTDLYGADVRLTFDPALVEVVDADGNASGVQIANGGFLQNTFTAVNETDNTLGTIEYAVTQLNPQPPANGSGVLAVITFKAKAVGSSPLTFTFAQLATRDGEEIPAPASNGSVDTTTPAGLSDVAIAMFDPTTARLSWTAASAGAQYDIYRDPAPYFPPVSPPYDTVLPPGVSYDDPGAIGGPVENHYYVLTVACTTGLASAPSNRVGEFDFALVAGTP